MTAGASFRGLSVAQVEAILEQIVASADTLQNFATRAADRVGVDGQYDMHMIQQAAERIGALASLGCSEASWTFDEWVLGHEFKALGKAVQARDGGHE